MAGLIMITKLVRKYLYGTTVYPAAESKYLKDPPPDNHDSRYKWNNHGSMQKQIWEDEY